MPEKISQEATIADIGESSPGSEIYQLRLKIKNFDEANVGAGRFVVLKPLNGATMVRPFTIAGKDAKKNELTIFIKTVGGKNSNTRLYAKLKPGDKISISGPQGRAFELLPEIDNYLLVAGGTGQAALFLLAEKIISAGKKLEFLVGVKKESELFGADLLEKIKIIPKIIKQNDPIAPGLVTDLLAKSLWLKKPRTAIIACGPRPMLKAVYDLACFNKLPCLVSVEELMACGAGSCKGCAVEMTDGKFAQACQDGPLFDAYWINWDKFISQPTTLLAGKKQLDDNLKVLLRGQENRQLELKFPWMIASGCLGLEEATKNTPKNIGALVTKGIKFEKKSGNPMPRLCELPQGMINSIGLPGPGTEKFIAENLPRWTNLNQRLIINIAGETVGEYGLVTKRLEESEKIGKAALEINISCPNVSQGGMAFGVDPYETFKVVQSVRQSAPGRFIIVKLTPNVTDIIPIAQAAVEAGADALTIGNTLLAMDIDIKTRRPKIGRVVGGYSGQGILPVILRLVHQVYRANLGVPIIGCGGISSGEDALKYFLAGASAIMVGTAWFANKNIFSEITETITKYLQTNNVANLQDLIGKLDLPKQ